VRKITVEVLASAREYRNKYPRTTQNKETDEAVAKALAKVPEK
jgi:hypothetical protein